MDGNVPDSGEVDDTSIGDATFLYRRVLNNPDPPVKQIIWDDNKKCYRPSSAAFTDHPNGSPMSVAIDDTLEELGIDPGSILENHKGYLLAKFPAKIARENNQGIARKPLEGDPAHGEVFGKKTKGVKKALATASTWHVEPKL